MLKRVNGLSPSARFGVTCVADEGGGMGEDMFVELRRNLQTIIPKRIAADLGLEVGDLVDVVEKDGVVLVIPVKKPGEEKEVQS